MLHLRKRVILRLLLAICVVAGFGSPGCKWLSDGALWELPLPLGGRSQEADQASQTQPLGSSDDRSGDRAVLACDSGTQRRSGWIRAVQAPRGDSSEPDYRWRYPALEELLARPPDQPSVGPRQPDWHRYLADKDPVVAANAAIALARSGDDSGATALAEAARSPGLNQPIRCAAVEALAGLKRSSAVPLLRELLGQYGRPAPVPGSTYHADLHAELIRGLARHVDPADDPNFVTALRSRAANVRLAALRAWSGGRAGSLPPEVAELRDDADRDVRAAALRTLARQRHGEAHRYLAAALRDHELKVRTAAIAGLGELGGSESRATLEGLLKDQPEAVRAAAVSALEQLGAEQAVLRAAGDRSWRVRLRVAQALAGYSDRDAVAVAGRLLQDPSAEVQRQVVLAVARWPLPLAGEILMEAMGGRSLTTRRTAAKQLAARWPPAGEFPIDDPPGLRAGALEELQGRFRRESGSGDRAAPTEAGGGGLPAAAITPRLLDQVEQLVRQQDVRALVDFGPGLAEALELLVCDRQQILPEVVYREVLPRYGTVFVALDRLTAADVSERRWAAGRLAELARERPLGRLAMARLVRLVAAEPDELVWQRALTAVAGDAGEPSIRLAYAAVSHPSAEVRRQACNNLAAHPHPRHAKMLVPALEDRDHAVVCAAVRALGAAGRLDDTQPLRLLLRTTNEALRLETAVSLVRLGDPAGTAALQRLAYSADTKIRCQVAVAMGGTADATFVPTLIHLLDDTPAVRRAALEGLPKAVGHDVSVPDGQGPAGTSERVRRWKRWFERREGIATSSASIELK